MAVSVSFNIIWHNTHKIDCGSCYFAKTASIMQKPSKKRITKDVEDDATQQGHKRSKCSKNGGTTAMQTELVDAATLNNIILPLCQPCSPHNHQSEVTSPPSALAAEAETSANNNAANLQPPNDHDHHSPASVARFPPVHNNPSFDTNELNEKFCTEFPKGRWSNSREEAFDEVQKWQNMHYNRVRKEGRQGAKCSCSGNSHSKAKDAGEKVVSTKQFSTSSNCPMEIRWSMKKKDGGRVRITYINGRHNHPYDLAYAATVQQLSGRDIQSILPILVDTVLA